MATERYVSHTEPEALIPNRIDRFIWNGVICDYPTDHRKALAIVEHMRLAVERRPKHRLFDRIWAGSWLPSL